MYARAVALEDVVLIIGSGSLVLPPIEKGVVLDLRGSLRRDVLVVGIGRQGACVVTQHAARVEGNETRGRKGLVALALGGARGLAAVQAEDDDEVADREREADGEPRQGGTESGAIVG